MSHRNGGAAGAAELWRLLVAVALRPRLWPVAALQILRLARPGWWRRWPPLPLPDPSYLRFRMETAYGDDARAPDSDDLVAYLQWCRDFRRLR